MSDLGEVIIAGRLNGKQRNRLKRLLNMMYRPSELAEEVGFDQNRIYSAYIPLGCPHKRDKQNHIWINGEDFRKWYQETYKKRPLEKGETFCLTCRKAVPLVDPVKKEKQGLYYYISKCPNCGRTLSKIVDQKRKRQ